jgi:hypothetical protein
MNALHTSTKNATLGLLLAQSRILRALAGGTVLQGTADELIDRLEIGPEDFRTALQDLVEGGWIFITTMQDGRMVVGRERRHHDQDPTRRSERRGGASRWENAGIALAR